MDQVEDQIWHILIYQEIDKRRKIQIFNYGNCRRDFTYIDDVS